MLREQLVLIVRGKVVSKDVESCCRLGCDGGVTKMAVKTCCKVSMIHLHAMLDFMTFYGLFLQASFADSMFVCYYTVVFKPDFFAGPTQPLNCRCVSS